MTETFSLHNRAESSNQDVMILNPILEVDSPVYAMNMDEYTPTITYIGEAVAGSADNEFVWRIKQTDTTSDVVITWADGTDAFDKQWSERLSYDY